MMSIERRRVRTAMHEAGHSVIGRVLDLKCGRVSAVRDHDSMGHAVFTEDPFETSDRWDRERRKKKRWPRSVNVAFRARIIALQAGAEAEWVLLRRRSRGDAEDRYQIKLALEEICNDAAGRGRLEQRLRRFARQLVRRHRKAIRAAAEALYEKGTLSDAEVRQLMREARTAKALPASAKGQPRGPRHALLD